MFIDPKLKTSDLLDVETGSWIDSSDATPEAQNGPSQTETGLSNLPVINGTWEWDLNLQTWYIKED